MSSLYVIVEQGEKHPEPRVATYSGFGGGDVYDERVEAEQDLFCLRATMAKYRPDMRYSLAELRIEALA